MNELLIPDAAQRDPRAMEVGRVWIAERGLHCTLRIGMYADRPEVREDSAWGIILADMSRHVADGLAVADGSERDNTLARIRDAFLQELAKPTSEMRGGFAAKRDPSSKPN